MTHPIYQVLNSVPVNRQARIVTTQSGCSEYDTDLTREEMLELFERVARKHRLLKLVLRVHNETQHKNLKARHRMGLKSNYRPKRAIEEYLRLGSAMAILAAGMRRTSFKEGREARQLLGAVENKWREEHPGCIWDGRQLVAPNGAVFSRSAMASQSLKD
jgi:hypothetical protein